MAAAINGTVFLMVVPFLTADSAVPVIHLRLDAGSRLTMTRPTNDALKVGSRKPQERAADALGDDSISQ
jgi:hypothetical protein